MLVHEVKENPPNFGMCLCESLQCTFKISLFQIFISKHINFKTNAFYSPLAQSKGNIKHVPFIMFIKFYFLITTDCSIPTRHKLLKKYEEHYSI